MVCHHVWRSRHREINSIQNLVSINAKKFDVDDLKTYKLETSELEGNKLIMKNGDVWELDGIPEPYNMSNPAFTSFVHEKTRPFARKVKQQFFNMGVKDNKETLPNIVLILQVATSKIFSIL